MDTRMNDDDFACNSLMLTKMSYTIYPGLLHHLRLRRNRSNDVFALSVRSGTYVSIVGSVQARSQNFFIRNCKWMTGPFDAT